MTILFSKYTKGIENKIERKKDYNHQGYKSKKVQLDGDS